MAKILVICSRHGNQPLFSDKAIEILSDRLTPDNISPNPTNIINDDRILIAIFNPCESLPVEKTSVCMGNLINPRDDWWKPMAQVPDGSYALFRSDKNTVELVTDIVSSRTIWYVQTQDLFLASTSQRAIVFFLQDFRPNNAAFSWMLSAGCLGPGLSWDARIRCLGANTCLSLDRPSWKVSIIKDDVPFLPQDLPVEEHVRRFTETLEFTFKHLRLDYSKWVLTLSGGCDSRALLFTLLNTGIKPKCITWGLEASLHRRGNDALIAKSLAEQYHLEHEYFKMDDIESIETIITRYLETGEGRVDNFAAYMDGFRMWKRLFEAGLHGIIRGDQAIADALKPGSHSDPFTVRIRQTLVLFSDYSNLKTPHELGLEEQAVPKHLMRTKDESLPTWHDRLRDEFQFPFFLGPINDAKCAYVEVVNPLVSRTIVKQARTLPDSLRMGKTILNTILLRMPSQLEFAGESSFPQIKDVVKLPLIKNLVYSELNSAYAKSVLPVELINYVSEKLSSAGSPKKGTRKSFTNIIKNLMPHDIQRKLIESTPIERIVLQKKLKMDFNLFAFRAFLICRMHRILQQDAAALNNC